MCFEKSWRAADRLVDCSLDGPRKSEPPSRHLHSDGVGTSRRVATAEPIRTAAPENGAVAQLRWGIAPSWPWLMAEKVQ